MQIPQNIIINVTNLNKYKDIYKSKFAYYLGISVRKKFKVKILRDADYDVWYKFIPALKEVFEVNYTSIPEATNGKLPESDANVLRKRLMLDKCGEGLYEPHVFP